MRSGLGRAVLAVVAGLVAWIAIVAMAGLIMRSSWPAYARVADAMTFTLPMMLARLSIGAVATLAAGWVTAAIAPRPMLVRLMPGLILLVVFIPQHIALWNIFPLWYHLTFLLSLVPLTYLGGALRASSETRRDRPSGVR
jgi:hypothetical protein